MPSYYQHPRPQFGYPASDYDCHTLQHRFPGYPSQTQGFGAHYTADTNIFTHMPPNPYEVYKNSSSHGAVGFNHRNNYSGATAVQHDPAPISAPLSINDYPPQQNNYKRTQYHEQNSATQQHEEEKPVGGVSAKLDYNMDEMTDFVVEMAVAIISPSSYNVDTYRKWVVQVLNATRLPSATILLSLSYMMLRVRSVTAARGFHPSEYTLYEYLTIALILGSKFLDDNTFQNKSWAEVSNIKVAVLNKEELTWLASFGHRLHHDPHCQDGFVAWQHRWNTYQAKNASAAISTRLQAPDAGFNHQQPLRSSIPGPQYHTQYPVSAMSSISLDSEPASATFGAGNYSPYDSWFPHRSRSDRSPPTAPHTGPNTPEFYAGHGGWHPYDNLQPQARPYGYGGNIPMSLNAETYPPPQYEQSPMSYGTNNTWNCHGAACQCSSCRQSHMPRYGPIVVG